MKTIVQKFGGTSLGSGERLHGVADIIQRTMATHRVVAVVSEFLYDQIIAELEQRGE